MEICFSFADEDDHFYSKVKEHLGPLQRSKDIECWSHHNVKGGEVVDEQVRQHLERAPVIALLLSSAYLASDKLYSDYEIALRRLKAGETKIIPILVRHCDYKKFLPGGVKILPADGQPIFGRPDPDEIYAAIISGIESVIQQISPVTVTSQNLNQVWMVPYLRNPLFIGRSKELEIIQKALRKDQDTTTPQAIIGLGGVGKTQLALEYAFRHRHNYRSIFWVLADTRETLNADYIKIAEKLSLPEKHLPEQHLVVAAVKNWLEQNRNWLLILDNADDLELLKDFMPTSYAGHVLITTRANAVRWLATPVEIQTLGLDEGCLFLLRRSAVLGENDNFEKIDADTHKIAKTIVSELGGLPLALDQAGAYIEATSCGFQGYLTRYRTEHKKLLSMRRGPLINHPDLIADHPASVATTWQIAFQRIEKVDIAAADLLRLCAFLAPDDIPESLIIRGESELPGTLKKLARNPSKLDAAIATLQKYSLISRNAATQTLDIHRLIQIVIRDAMNKNEERAWAIRIAQILSKVFPWPEEVETWPLCEQLLPHVQICTSLMREKQIEIVEEARLLHNVGWFLYKRGLYSQAQRYYEETIAIRVKMLGEMHPDSLISQYNLVTIYRVQGKYNEAESLTGQLLAITRLIFGDNHIETAKHLNNLAAIYGDQGFHEVSETLFQQVLAIRSENLGSNHPLTLRTMSNLAGVYSKMGKYEMAEALLQRALAIQREVLGDAHPDTLFSQINMAVMYLHQGKPNEAEILQEQTIALQRSVLSDAHPDTLISLTNLATSHFQKGEYKIAQSLLEQALNIQHTVLSDNHPVKVDILHNLALVYLEQSEYEKAEALFMEALLISKKTRGLYHLGTLSNFNPLMEAYNMQGKYDEAQSLFQQTFTLPQLKKIFGEVSPEVAHSLHKLTMGWNSQEQYEEAFSSFMNALNLLQKKLPGTSDSEEMRE